ncbi:MAG: acetolactate synthase AlsS [Chlamydiota bacterium]
MSKQETKTLAKLLADCLVTRGVRYIFGIPGAKIDGLFDALIDTPIRIILCRHEQNAVFMAAMVGRMTGKAGVVLVTSGPGVSNLVTGLLTATTEGDPVVALGGNVPRSMKLKESHQSTDNVRITEGATKWSVEASLAENVPEILENAFRKAESPRAGAVFVSIPQDLLLEKAVGETPIHPTRPVFGGAREETISNIASTISRAEKPILLLGMEASRPENTIAIRHLLEKHPLPVVSTYQAAGVISKALLPCFVGRVGLFKNQPGDQLLDEADCIMTVGFSPVEYDPEIWNARSPKMLIHIDYRQANLHNTYIPHLEGLGEISLTLNELAKRLPARKTLLNRKRIQKLQKSLEEIRELTETGQGSSSSSGGSQLVRPLWFIHELKKMMDETMIISCDVGTHYMWLARYLLSHEPHQLLFSNGQQTLGVALPWAMASRLIKPNARILSVSGDGGFLFSAMELETAVREKIPFVHCVWNDGSYDMVRQQQRIKYGRETAVALHPIDYVAFAKSFGAVGYRIGHPKELLPTFEEAFQQKRPVIIDVPIDYSDNRWLFEKAH